MMRRMMSWLPPGSPGSCSCASPALPLPSTPIQLLQTAPRSNFHPEQGLQCLIVEFISEAAPDTFITFMRLSIESGEEFMALII